MGNIFGGQALLTFAGTERLAGGSATVSWPRRTRGNASGQHTLLPFIFMFLFLSDRYRRQVPVPTYRLPKGAEGYEYQKRDDYLVIVKQKDFSLMLCGDPCPGPSFCTNADPDPGLFSPEVKGIKRNVGRRQATVTNF